MRKILDYIFEIIMLGLVLMVIFQRTSNFEILSIALTYMVYLNTNKRGKGNE